jgi:hypothetical protein
LGDEGREVSGFAPLPHRLCEAEDVSDNAYRILGAIMRLAHDRPRCTASNEEIGRVAGGKNWRTVLRGIEELEGHGALRRAADPATGRRSLDLLWDRLGAPKDNLPDGLSNLTTHPVKFDNPPLSNLTPPSTPYKEGEGEKNPPYPPNGGEGGGVRVNGPGDDEVELERTNHPTPKELARLAEIADSLFDPQLDFAAQARRWAHVFQAAWVAQAMKDAAGSGKSVTWNYVMGILRRYDAQGGPDRPAAAGKGKVLPAAPPSQTNPTGYYQPRRRPPGGAPRPPQDARTSDR